VFVKFRYGQGFLAEVSSDPLYLLQYLIMSKHDDPYVLTTKTNRRAAFWRVRFSALFGQSISGRGLSETAGPR